MMVEILSIIGAIATWVILGHIGFWLSNWKYRDIDDVIFPSLMGIILFISALIFLIIRLIKFFPELRSDINKIKKKLRIK